VERGREGIADDLEDISVRSMNGSIQNLVMSRQKSGHFVRMFLREFGRAFNISEEECDRAAWRGSGFRGLGFVCGHFGFIAVP
jgi:hypothetical protein